MSRQFENKVVFITGAGSGIGQACAEAFAAQGARVAVADISQQAADETTTRITQAGGQAFSLVGDVASAEQVAAMVSQVVARWGRLDIGLNNAGISSPLEPMGDTDESDFDRVMGVNVKGVWLCMRAQIRQMLAQGGGCIVNMASALSLKVSVGSSFYVASKFAVAGLTRTAAVEYAASGIRINAVCPGIVSTPLFEKSVTDPDTIAMMKRYHPMDRFGTPEEIANAVLWLASDASSFSTGALMSVDGGWTAQ
ncbi:MAG: SDR family NAD(P)-dependent oxidoreductase [Haliea sp.]